MQPVIVKPVADPLDDIDRVTPVDSMMARQDRADLPGNRSDQPGNDENDPDRNELGADLGSRAAGRDPDDVPDPNAVDPLSDDDEIDPEIDPDVDLAIES